MPVCAVYFCGSYFCCRFNSLQNLLQLHLNYNAKTIHLKSAKQLFVLPVRNLRFLHCIVFLPVENVQRHNMVHLQLIALSCSAVTPWLSEKEDCKMFSAGNAIRSILFRMKILIFTSLKKYG